MLRSIVNWVGELFEFARENPAAATTLGIVLLIMLGSLATVAYSYITINYPTRHQVVDIVNNNIAPVNRKLDGISNQVVNLDCQIEWNQYGDKIYQIQAQQDSINVQLAATNRYLAEVDGKATARDLELRDDLNAQLTYLKRQMVTINPPPCERQ